MALIFCFLSLKTSKLTIFIYFFSSFNKKNSIIWGKYGHLLTANMTQFLQGTYDLHGEIQRFREQFYQTGTALGDAPIDDDEGAGGTMKIILQWHDHINYLGEIFIGVNNETDPASSQVALVQYDTGSSWLAVTSSLCDNCDQLKIAYDLDKSSTYKTNTFKLESQRLGNSEIKG